MSKNSNGKQVAQSGLTKAMPKNHGGKQTTSYNKTTSKTISYVDKQTGSYVRATYTEVVSTGDTSKKKSTERVGSKAEHRITSTYRFGDKNGYTEIQEKKVRNVNYAGSKNTDGNKCNGGSKYYLKK